MVAAFLLWRIMKAGGDMSAKAFKTIYRSCQLEDGTTCHQGQDRDGETATKSSNKVLRWKDSFFFVGENWEFLPDDPRPDVSVPRYFVGICDLPNAWIWKQKVTGSIPSSCYTLHIHSTKTGMVPIRAMNASASGKKNLMNWWVLLQSTVEELSSSQEGLNMDKTLLSYIEKLKNTEIIETNVMFFT
ncbi:Uncharacterized protein Fot_14939 [Forsythia ovata]|uniref:Uncharacterized protein n=1 Tax=Forsythia ovata TaxID=205694 RepID=A0ABD1W829_9LAMI